MLPSLLLLPLVVPEAVRLNLDATIASEPSSSSECSIPSTASQWPDVSCERFIEVHVVVNDGRYKLMVDPDATLTAFKARLEQDLLPLHFDGFEFSSGYFIDFAHRAVDTLAVVMADWTEQHGMINGRSPCPPLEIRAIPRFRDIPSVA